MAHFLASAFLYTLYKHIIFFFKKTLYFIQEDFRGGVVRQQERIFFGLEYEAKGTPWIFYILLKEIEKN